MPALRIYEVGERYGALVVTSRRSTATPVTVRCDCGTVKQVNAAALAHTIRSCGLCTRWAAGAAAVNWQGGMTDHPLYQSYQAMLARCSRPTHHKYPEYGARGITVCQAWTSDFWTFVADVGPRPDGCTLDRIDNDGNYEPSNVRWATATQQAGNRRPRRTRGAA